MTLTSVKYNDGTDEERIAIVIRTHDDGSKDLKYLDKNDEWQTAYKSVQRAKADYGPEGGGATWHY